tara:strand:- start:7901 stop:8983 length:1083 start_codon:yes stop_codon:yes gene_type:complete
MSRARELAKVGGKNQQVIAGLSSHVGVSTFLNNVHMFANLDVGGNVTVTGTTAFNGGTLTLGDSASDNVVFGADVNSNIIPNTDNAYDLGSSSQEWKDLFIDGTAHIDTLDVDGNAGVIGNLTLTGNGDFNGDLDVDGTTNLDGTNVVGTLAVTGAATVDNLSLNGNTVTTSSGNLTIDSAGGTTTVSDNLTVSGTVTFNTALASGNLATSGVSANTYGSSTAIPILVVNDKGLITSASTTAVDSTTIEQLNTSVSCTDTGTNGLVTVVADGSTVAVFDQALITVTGNILPEANGTRDLGASGTRWANIYSSDLDLSNEAKGANSIDNTWGSYLIEEGENDLFLKNRRTGKQYKFVLQEV